ncbi:MAG: NADH dehydrogenase [Candidatus Azotimanducaceae bacterium]|jgi:NADH dehydrogenase
MKVAVTGATGYIGRHLVRRLVDQGIEVLAMSRSKPIQSDIEWLFFDLGEAAQIDLPNVDVVIHLAANTRNGSITAQNELDAGKYLLAQANSCDARFIFVSSQTASTDASSEYGRIKFSVEQAVLSSNGVVVRPGQVYGGEPLGLFGSITELVARLPVLPLFLPVPLIQPVHIDDLVTAIQNLSVKRRGLSRVYCIGSVEPIAFSKYLRATAKYRLRIARLAIPVPMVVVSLLAIAAGPKSPFARLESINTLNLMSTKENLRELNLVLRPLEAGLQRSGNGRRLLLLEALTFFRYVLDRRPNFFVLRSYVRAIASLTNGVPLGLHQIFQIFPSLVVLYDGADSQKSDWDKEMMLRIKMATVLAEASPIGAQEFLGVGKKSGFMRIFVFLGYVVFGELISRVARVLLRPFLLNRVCNWQGLSNDR